jgi:hypothetical protein
MVAVRKTFRPWRDFGRLRASSPSHKWLGYFQVQRRDAENGNRDGRAPQSKFVGDDVRRLKYADPSF